MAEDEYKMRCAKRTRAVVQFSRSEDFFEGILIGSLSSIPRWRYAATLEAKGRKASCARTSDALQALLRSTRVILSGKNVLCEFLINRDSSHEVFRLALYSSLMRASLYMSEKNDKVPFYVKYLMGVNLQC